VEQSIEAYREVTLDDIRDYALLLLDPAKFALCVLGKCPKKAEKAMSAMVKGG
jgi:predicted Zn-dependent peptidase